MSSFPDILRKVPPQNLEAEQSTIGAMFLDNEALAQMFLEKVPRPGKKRASMLR